MLIEAPRDHVFCWDPVGVDSLGWNKGYQTETLYMHRGTRYDGSPSTMRYKLKMSFVTEESWERYNSTVLHYKATRGWCVTDPSEMSEVEIFHQVYRYFPRFLNMSHKQRMALTEEEIREAIDTYFHFNPRMIDEYQRTRATLVGYAYTDYYSDTFSEHLSPQDLVIYVYLTLLAARHYAEQGLITRGSVNPYSREEKHVWATLRRMGLTKEHALGGYQDLLCHIIDTDAYDIESPGEPLNLLAP